MKGKCSQQTGSSKRVYGKPVRHLPKKQAHELDNCLVPLPAKTCFTCSKYVFSCNCCFLVHRHSSVAATSLFCSSSSFSSSIKILRLFLFSFNSLYQLTSCAPIFCHFLQLPPCPRYYSSVPESLVFWLCTSPYFF